MIALAKHNPAHIYFTGRNLQAAQRLLQEVQEERPKLQMTFIELDMTSLASVKKACQKFVHERLDVLM